jgi:hypothetical protein
MAAQWTKWRGGEQTEGRGDNKNLQAAVGSRGSSGGEAGGRVANPNTRVTGALVSRLGPMPASWYPLWAGFSRKRGTEKLDEKLRVWRRASAPGGQKPPQSCSKQGLDETCVQNDVMPI